MSEQAVYSDIAYIGKEIFRFDEDKIQDNAVKSGTVNKVVITIKTGKILFNFHGDNPSELNSYVAAKDKIIEITGIEDILNFKAVSGIEDKACIYYTYFK